jgi:hypothetical protein
MHAIIKSQITERSVQHDGRVYITEVHTFDDGMEYSTTYLADPKDSEDEALRVRAIELVEDRDAGEKSLADAAVEAVIIAKRDQYFATLDDKTLKDAVKLTDEELATFKDSDLAVAATVDDGGGVIVVDPGGGVKP